MKRLLAWCLAIAVPLCSAGAALIEEVPFVVTPDNVTMAMLTLAKVVPEDYVNDLGSGDGRIVITAAKRFGARGLGIELDAALVEKSRVNARAAGVQERVRFEQGDVLVADIARASVVTVYLLPALMGKLQSRFINELAPGTRVVSHSFDMGSAPPIEKMNVNGRTIYFWLIPIPMAASQ